MLLLITFLSFAQNKFEPGYYIDYTGVKTECLIKNYDWKNSPRSIEIKKDIEEIKEFAIYNKSKFIKATINFDESSQNKIALEDNPNPKFVEKTILLKVLVEGKSNLYSFEDSDYERYFYSVNDKIEQLVYKRYNNSEGNIALNESYKQQLFANFKCNNDQKSIVALKYDDIDLIDYFIKTNNCLSGITETKVISEKRKFETNFKVNLLLNSVSQNIVIPYLNINNTSKKTNSVSFGFESEIVLPYNNKNWSFVFDPSYTSYKETNTSNYTYFNINYTVVNENKILLIRLPLGIRRYFTLNEKNKFYTNLAVSINVTNNNIDPKYNEDGSFTSYNFAFGLGYQYKKYSIELKLNNKALTYSNPYSGKEYSLNQMFLKLGYRLF